MNQYREKTIFTVIRLFIDVYFNVKIWLRVSNLKGVNLKYIGGKAKLFMHSPLCFYINIHNKTLFFNKSKSFCCNELKVSIFYKKYSLFCICFYVVLKVHHDKYSIFSSKMSLHSEIFFWFSATTFYLPVNRANVQIYWKSSFYLHSSQFYWNIFRAYMKIKSLPFFVSC